MFLAFASMYMHFFCYVTNLIHLKQIRKQSWLVLDLVLPSWLELHVLAHSHEAGRIPYLLLTYLSFPSLCYKMNKLLFSVVYYSCQEWKREFFLLSMTKIIETGYFHPPMNEHALSFYPRDEQFCKIHYLKFLSLMTLYFLKKKN